MLCVAGVSSMMYPEFTRSLAVLSPSQSRSTVDRGHSEFELRMMNNRRKFIVSVELFAQGLTGSSRATSCCSGRSLL
jgi:hypothetical protein